MTSNQTKPQNLKLENFAGNNMYEDDYIIVKNGPEKNLPAREEIL